MEAFARGQRRERIDFAHALVGAIVGPFCKRAIIYTIVVQLYEEEEKKQNK